MAWKPWCGGSKKTLKYQWMWRQKCRWHRGRRRDKGSNGAEPSREYHDWQYWWAWWQMSWNQPLSLFFLEWVAYICTAKPLREVMLPNVGHRHGWDEEMSCRLLTTVWRTAALVEVPPQLEDSTFGREGDMMQLLNPYIFTNWGTCQWMGMAKLR